jgi:NAD(P)-dependent dehydrogenase (short-subunit alcohol dehydrogenase family)
MNEVLTMRLQDKVVLVTGSSKGIGRAIALGVAKEGAHVIVNYNSDLAGAQAVVDAIKAMGRRSIAVKADVGQMDQLYALFAAVEQEFGRLDVLVNNAGITGWTRVFEATPDQWDEVMHVNLRGSFFCSIEAAKMMRAHEGGSIINISTNCAALGVKHHVAYAASKGGIQAMTKQLAVELAQYKIRVNTFGPGPTSVDRCLDNDVNYRTTWGEMTPMKRTAEPDEMVGPVVFLASDDSSYMTGQVFFVDGGWSVYGRIPEAHMDMAMTKNE